MTAVVGKSQGDVLAHAMACDVDRPGRTVTHAGADACELPEPSGLTQSSLAPTEKATTITRRKDQHISICLQQDVTFRKASGFERYDLVHQALPELSLADIDMSTTFLGKHFRLPFFIEALTGGSQKAGKINRNLARAANQLGIGMGLGSQRAMLEHPAVTNTYQVRQLAPDVLLLGNIGATQLAGMSTETIAGMIEAIGADGLAIHLNAAQEICQPEGDTDWREVLTNIKRVCAQTPFPVVVKETGCGVDGQTAKRLASAGVDVIDIAGAGGTSFIKVESYRGNPPDRMMGEWGIPTAEALKQCRRFVTLPLVASGGIRNGIECAKCIAMGASLVGFALPLLQAAHRSHHDVIHFLTARAEELKKTMFLIGAKDIAALRQATIVSMYAD